MRWMALVCIFLLLAAGIGEKTEHFYVKYDDMQYLSPGTGRALENAYQVVNDQLGSLPKVIKVIIIDDDKMDVVGKHVEAFSAWNHQSSTIVLRGETIKDSKALPVVAKHEICHLSLNVLLDDKDDAEFGWMEEGICMVISEEPLDDVKVSRYIVRHGFLDTDGISKAVDSGNYTDAKNGYLQSFSLCKYITKTYGTGALADIVKSPASDFEDAFYQRTGEDFDRFYARWEKHVLAEAARDSRVRVVTVNGYLDLSMAEA